MICTSTCWTHTKITWRSGEDILSYMWWSLVIVVVVVVDMTDREKQKISCRWNQIQKRTNRGSRNNRDLLYSCFDYFLQVLVSSSWSVHCVTWSDNALDTHWETLHCTLLCTLRTLNCSPSLSLFRSNLTFYNLPFPSFESLMPKIESSSLSFSPAVQVVQVVVQLQKYQIHVHCILYFFSDTHFGFFSSSPSSSFFSGFFFSSWPADAASASASSSHRLLLLLSNDCLWPKYIRWMYEGKGRQQVHDDWR